MADKKISVSAKSRRLMIRETTTSYLFLAPFLVFFVMFVIYPMFMCVYTSFFDATMGREDIFVGFDNYKTLFNDPIFWTALKNTANGHAIELVSGPRRPSGLSIALILICFSRRACCAAIL